MDYGIKVVSVGRLNGEARKILIDVLSFRLELVKNGNNIEEIERFRLDGSRNLFIPPAPYRKAMRVARGIFFDRRGNEKKLQSQL